jgi:hypothetical protein
VTRAILVFLFVGLSLMAPFAGAQDEGACLDVAEHRIDLVEGAGGVGVTETIAYASPEGTVRSSDHFNVTIRLPRAAERVSGVMRLADGSESPIPQESLAKQEGEGAASEPFVRFSTADASPDPTPDNFTIVLSYEAQGVTTFAKSLQCATASLLVFAEPTEGHTVYAVNMGEVVSLGDGRFHVTPGEVGAGYPVTVAFQSEAVAPEVRDMTPYVWGVAGLVAGLLIMFFLLKQGLVTVRRTPKYEKGGGMESVKMLEARRRTLMAAMKELEAAHDAKEIPDEAYSPLKEEYKAQAVRVMRTLESKKEPKAE